MCGLLSRPVVTRPAAEPLDLVLPGVTSSVPLARQRFRDFIAPLPLAEEERAQVALLFGEAVTNAVQHGSPRAASDQIRIACRLDAGEILIAIADDGPGFDPASVGAAGEVGLAGVPDLTATSGRGIFLMRACGGVSYEFPDRGTVCLLTYRLSDPEGEKV